MKAPTKRGNPFLRIQAEYINWTGYDAALLEEAVERGLALEEENAKFRQVSPQRAREQFWKGWGDFGKIAASLVGIAALVFAFAAMFAGINADGNARRHYEEGYTAAASGSIAYVESQYRHIDPAQIRLEFPYGPDIFNRAKWVTMNTDRYSNIVDVQNRYDEIVKDFGAYKIFITPKK